MVAISVAASLALVWVIALALYVVAVAVAASALSGVVRGALYLYATEDRSTLPDVDPEAVLCE